jgi:hypothetical protein
MKKSNLLLFLALLFAFGACLKDEIDLDDLSQDVAIQRSIAMPLVYGSLDIHDFTDADYDSLIIQQDGDTIKLYLIVDLGYTDTIPLGDLGQDMEFEYLYIHHGFTNSLPIGLDVQFYLYDSTISQNLDTIFLTDDPSVDFIPAAEVDGNGLVIEDIVTEQRDYVSLEPSTLDYLQNEATHLILDAVVPSTGGLVKVLDYYSLDFKLGVEALGTLVTELDSII